MAERKKNNFGKILTGCGLILVGILFLLKSFGIEINIFFEGWWAFLIIIPSIISFFIDDGKTEAIAGIVVGVLLFLAIRGLVEWISVIKISIGVIIILYGISIIFKIGKKGKKEGKDKEV